MVSRLRLLLPKMQRHLLLLLLRLSTFAAGVTFVAVVRQRAGDMPLVLLLGLVEEFGC